MLTNAVLPLLFVVFPIALHHFFFCRIRYLKVVRERDLDAEVKDGVDTLLLKLYAELDQTEELKQLASSPNNCVLVCMSSNMLCGMF